MFYLVGKAALSCVTDLSTQVSSLCNQIFFFFSKQTPPLLSATNIYYPTMGWWVWVWRWGKKKRQKTNIVLGFSCFLLKFNAISNLHHEMMRGKMKSWRQWQIGTTLDCRERLFFFFTFSIFRWDASMPVD